MNDADQVRMDKTRSITGLFAVVAGDVVIALAAILGIIYVARGSGTSSNAPQIVAILSGGFTAIGTMTTAYFGIKSISNATSNIAGAQRPGATGTTGARVPVTPPAAAGPAGAPAAGS